MDDATRVAVLAGAGYASGVLGAVAPGLTGRVFGIRDTSGEYRAVVRMMSFRNLALAGAMSVVDGDEQTRSRFFTIAAGMFAADTLAAIVSAATGTVSVRTAASLGTLTAGLAIVAATGARLETPAEA